MVLALTACAVPAGETSQYMLWSRKLGQGEPDTPTTATPGGGCGRGPQLKVTWPALQATRYLGLVEHGDGSSPLGCTVSTVTP